MRFDNSGEIATRHIMGGGVVHPLRDAFIRAAVTGCASGLLIGLVASLWRYGSNDAIMGGAVAALVVFLIAWTWPRAESVAPSMPIVSQEQGGSVVLLSPRTDDGQDTQSERLRAFVARAAIDSGSRALRGAGFTDREIARFRDMLIAQRWAEWRPGGKSQGWDLAADAQQVLEALR